MLEFEHKITRIRELLATFQLEGIYLQRVSSFAWATCGAAAYVNVAATHGPAALLITGDQHYLITDNIEAPRLEQEERLSQQGWNFQVGEWHDVQAITPKLTRGKRIGSDDSHPDMLNLSEQFSRLRAELTPDETIRFRMLGRLCAAAMEAAIIRIRPGMIEHEIAGILAQEAEQRGVQAIVNLVGSDERISAFRHPLPTEKKLNRYGMLVLCGRRWGLVCSLTRLVHFGALPAALLHKLAATARVEAVLHAASRPGMTLGEIFDRGIQAYAACGFPEEWHLHHQGGAAGYEPREILARPGSLDRVALGQAYAWNPSITGVKSEDTLLVGETMNEVITEISGWPQLAVELADRLVYRPAILQID